jgi:hypothetical protein
MREIVLKEAAIKKWGTKTNSLGCIIGQLTIEIESDDPDADFEGIPELQKGRVTLIIQGEPQRKEPSGF